MGEKRVIEQVASNEVHNDDWFLKDSPTQDTSKISATNLKAILGADGTLALEEIANAIAEEYNPSATYNKGAYVFYEGAFYKCTQNGTTGTWDSSKWNITSVINLINSNAGDITELEYKSNNAIAMNHSTIATYNKGDYVFYWFHLYRCLEDDVYGAWDDSKWEEVNILEYIDYVLENAGQVQDVTVDGTSVVTNKVAEIEIPVKDVQVKTDSTYDSVVDASGNAKIDLSNKADKDGMYEELFAGNLLSDNTETDNTPYTYRPSPSGKSCVDLSVVGGTVAWNQLADKSVLRESGTVGDLTLTNNNDGYLYISGSITNSYIELSGNLTLNFIKGHKYLFNIPTAPSGVNRLLTLYGTAFGNFILTSATIKECNNTLSERIYPRFGSNETVSVNNFKYYIGVIDLTQAFGSTIADYLYTIDQANAGAGLAKLQEWGFCTKSYYAYNSGALMSVNASSHDTIGFNQWDEEWEQGAIYLESGNNFNADNRIRSKNHIHVKPNTEYYVMSVGSSVTDVFFYDENKTFITYNNPRIGGRFTVTIPSNCHYIRFCTWVDYGETYRNNICINVSDISRNGTYEPYTKHTYPLDSNLTLRGIPKLDANNSLYYDGDTYESDGSVKRKYGVVDLGTLDYNYYSGNLFTVQISNLKPVSNNILCNALCSIYVAKVGNVYASIDGSFVAGFNNAPILAIHDSRFTDATSFKTAMDGVYLIYELATPTSETADAYENPQLVGSTEEFIDTRDVPIPVGGERKYYTDLKAKLEELAKIPDVPSTNGTYTLKATRSASGVTYNWISD